MTKPTATAKKIAWYDDIFAEYLQASRKRADLADKLYLLDIEHEYLMDGKSSNAKRIGEIIRQKKIDWTLYSAQVELVASIQKRIKKGPQYQESGLGNG